MKFSIAFTVLITAIVASSHLARAGELLVLDEQAGTVGQYNATTGATINGSFISGLSSYPRALALSGGDLYTTVAFPYSIAQYNASTGATINASFQSLPGESTSITFAGSNYYVTGDEPTYIKGYTPSGLAFSDVPNSPYGAWGSAVLGNDLFVSLVGNDKPGQGSVAEYDATTGALINANFITGLSVPEGLTIVGNNLYVVSNANDTQQPNTNGLIGEYNATTGAPINASLVTGLSQPVATAIDGNDLYVTSRPMPEFGPSVGIVGEYDATTGATINATLITGFEDPQGIVFMAPEPATWIMLAIGAAAIAVCGRRRRIQA
jgi:hypothetical protein